VQEWRNGVETDLDDVLQISNVFTNVSKGEVAKANDLQKAFSTTDVHAVVKEVRVASSSYDVASLHPLLLCPFCDTRR
jgi:ribosome maturation protein Sdo1